MPTTYTAGRQRIKGGVTVGISRRTSQVAALVALVLGMAATAVPTATAAVQRTRCGRISASAYKGSRSWVVGVDKLTCSAGKRLAQLVTPKAAAARRRATVKNGSFTCIVYPGGAECRGKGGQSFGVASVIFGGG